MGNMGFTITKSTETSANNTRTANENEKILSFDSGNFITYDDACHHLITMGTTGSGKTASIILPTLSKLFEAGQSGLIIDIKGNLRGQVKTLAEECGRSADIIEFGTSTTATPLNILESMSMHEVSEFIELLSYTVASKTSQNRAFYMRGNAQVCDCIKFLRLLDELTGTKYTSLALVNEFLCDPLQASKLFNTFIETLYDADDNNQERFVNRIQTSKFHILNYMIQTEYAKSETYLEQFNYEISTVRTAIQTLMATPGITNGFANVGSQGLDMTQILSQGQIVLLRFGPDTGTAGQMLSRKLITEYYKYIFTLGTEKAKDRPTFVCFDEFQEVALLDGSRFSDSNFISQAREFKASIIASTQSVSALISERNSLDMVNSFVSNCNNRILFHSDDPKTQEINNRFTYDKTLMELNAGEACVMQFDSKTREHYQSIETCNTVYQATKSILEKSDIPLAHTSNETTEMEQIKTIIIDLQEIHEENLKKKKLQEEFARMINISMQYSESDDDDGNGDDEQNQEEKQTGDKKQEPTTSTDDDTDNIDGDDDEPEVELDPNNVLYKEFADFFIEADQILAIPLGWYEHVANAFRAMKENNMPVIIRSLTTHEGGLYVTRIKDTDPSPFRTSENSNTKRRILNSFLSETKRICTLCSNQTDNKEKELLLYPKSSILPVCNECLAKHNLLPKTQENIANEQDESHNADELEANEKNNHSSLIS